MSDVSVIEAKRLILRDWRMSDAPDLEAILGDKEVMRYSMTGPMAATERHAWLLTRAALAPSEDLLDPRAIELRESGRVIGTISLERNAACRAPHEAELGIRLRRASWGQGLAREAVQALATKARQDGRPLRMLTHVDPGNKRSLKLVRALGARYIREVMLPGYDYPDHQYALEP